MEWPPKECALDKMHARARKKNASSEDLEAWLDHYAEREAILVDAGIPLPVAQRIASDEASHIFPGVFRQPGLIHPR